MGCIYKITNIKDNKSYIGQTRTTLAHRYSGHWSNALSKNGPQYPMYQDMKKLGKDNFTVEQIEECPNDQLNDKEKYWIAYYDTFNNGYNQTKGGAGYYQGKTIYCFTLTGKLHKVYPDLFTASQDTGVNQDVIKAGLYGGLTAGGYQWFYEEDKEQVQDLSHRDSNYGKIKTLILQYSLDGDFIQAYRTTQEAQEATNIHNSGIVRCMSGEIKMAGGYQWKRGFYGEDIPQKILALQITKNELRKGKKQKVICQDNGENRTYDSLSAAARNEHLSRNKVTYCCNIYPRTTCIDGRTFRYAEQ